MVDHVETVGWVRISFHISISPKKANTYFLVGHILNLDHLENTILLSKIIAYQMERLRNISNLRRSQVSATSKVTLQQPSVVIFCLSIKSNYLSTLLQMRNGIVVTTSDLCAKRINTEPTSFSVTKNFFIITLCCFFICKTGALIATWILCINSRRSLKHRSDLSHLSQRQKQIPMDLWYKTFFANFKFPCQLLEFSKTLIALSGGEGTECDWIWFE